MSHASIPEISNCEAMRDYFEGFVQNGCGQHKAMIDKRGMAFLVLPEHAEKDIALMIPPEGEMVNNDDGKIYVRAVAL